MKQNVYQIPCICQHTLVKDNEVFKFQRIYAKHFNTKNRIKSVFATICNTYYIIQCKIYMICLINSKKRITVQPILSKSFWANSLTRKLWLLVQFKSTEESINYYYENSIPKRLREYFFLVKIYLILE